ncbi:MAG: HD domain-containing protein [Pyrinomonadaceae bacterium]|nr:HD domain-containing protein [Pyrinomonadaceae bacterium]
MSKVRSDKACRAYTALVVVAGIALWLAAAIFVSLRYALSDQLTILALVPLTVVTGMFPNTFPLPSVLKTTPEKMTFTLSDAIVLLVACWYGVAPSIFIAAIEGFTSSRRTIRRLSSNLFSFGMMSLAAAAAGAALSSVLRAGGGTVNPSHKTFPLVAVALFLASITHILVNTGLISTLFALRNRHPVLKTWKANVLWAGPMFLPTSAAASLMYMALQYDVLMMVIIGAPLLLAIFFGHRQQRNSIQERINSLEKAHHEMVEALAVAINAKDEVTHEHVLRVQIYSAGVARLLGCNAAEIEALKAGALLHDIGKIAVPDYILNKPGKLTAAEFEKMKMHTVVGAQILGRVEFPYPVVPVVRHHHERWDGKGYPDGLSAEDIPLTARILSVVDCFDAVREDRQYRKGLTREEAINLIMQGSGTQYDPRVVGMFITHLPEFEAEILAHKDVPAPSFGIEEMEQLSEAARQVEPAAGLAEAGDAAYAPANTRQLRAIHILTQAVNAARGREEILETFTDKLRDLAPFNTCSVTLVMPETGENIIMHAAGEHGAALIGRKITFGEGVTGWTMANRTSFCNTDPKLDFPPALAEKFADYRTLAAFPLIKDKEVLGAVSLYSSEIGEYTNEHQQLIEEAAAFVATALSAAPDEAGAPIRLQEAPVTLVPDTARVYKTTALNLSQASMESELTH